MMITLTMLTKASQWPAWCDKVKYLAWGRLILTQNGTSRRTSWYTSKPASSAGTRPDSTA